MGFALPPLRQRDRATLDFFASLGRTAVPLGPEVDADLAKGGLTAETMPDDLDARLEAADEVLKTSKAYRLRSLVGEWHSRYTAAATDAAFEAIRPEVEDEIERLKEGPAELTLDPNFDAPAYWDGVHFHRTAGGWDGHEYAGLVHGELIHKRMVDRLYPGGIFKQRKFVAGLAPKESYKKILEMGSSTGHYTQALTETYPDAEIYGVELSRSTLEHAQRVANSKGYAWKLFQKRAEDTGFDANSFDLVTSYILLHEIPADIIRACFEEAFRVLEPGGDVLMSDVTRYADMDKLGVWKAENTARYGGEPWWRESASLDLKEVAESAGFVDVKAWGEEPRSYPYIVMGRKPA